MIRFKSGSIKSVANEFNVLSEIEKDNRKEEERDGAYQKYKWVNDIMYQDHNLSIVELVEKKGNEETMFVYISSFKAKKKTVVEIAAIGRKRWKIENEGFNMQKNQGYELEHLYSKDPNAMKNYYLLLQMAHMIKQLYEKGTKAVKVLKASIKKSPYAY